MKKRRQWYPEPERPCRPDRPVEFLTPTARIMEAANEYLAGRAIWERVSGLWRCVSVSPALNFLLKTDPASARLELVKRGFSWNWLGSGIGPVMEQSLESGQVSGLKHAEAV